MIDIDPPRIKKKTKPCISIFLVRLQISLLTKLTFYSLKKDKQTEKQTDKQTNRQTDRPEEVVHFIISVSKIIFT